MPLVPAIRDRIRANLVRVEHHGDSRLTPWPAAKQERQNRPWQRVRSVRVWHGARFIGEPHREGAL
jgi:hypothetical protein